MTADLTDPIYHDEDAARAWLERYRWGDHPSCPHCGSFKVIRMQGKPERRIKNKPHRAGLFHCQETVCAEQFTVTVGSVMERSHIPLTKWVAAIHLLTASKKGISSHQLSRMLGLTYKSAWFLSHRIREAMSNAAPLPLGGDGKVIEADEAYKGKKEIPTPSPQRKGRPYIKSGKQAQKRPIFALVERDGAARAFSMPVVTGENIRDVLVRNADRKSRLHTDESNLYPKVGREFAAHETVNHSAKEYSRGKGDEQVTTNSVEGFFGIFTRGLGGVYQHCGEQHLQRYLDEFSFRYSNRAKLGVDDAERAQMVVRGAIGKRLTYAVTKAA